MKVNWFIIGLVALVLGKLVHHVGKDYQQNALDEKILQERQEKNSVPTLGDLQIVDEKSLENEIMSFNSKESKTDDDLHRLAYFLVAFSFTPTSLPDGYRPPETCRAGAGDWLLSGLACIPKTALNAAARTADLTDEEKRLKPKKEASKTRGVEIWHSLAEKEHKGAAIGLAWYYGKIKKFDEAYYFRRLAFLRGDKDSNVWAIKYSKKVSSESVKNYEEKLKGLVGPVYMKPPEQIFTK